jgi:hypothetical protein
VRVVRVHGLLVPAAGLRLVDDRVDVDAHAVVVEVGAAPRPRAVLVRQGRADQDGAEPCRPPGDGVEAAGLRVELQPEFLRRLVGSKLMDCSWSTWIT